MPLIDPHHLRIGTHPAGYPRVTSPQHRLLQILLRTGDSGIELCEDALLFLLETGSGKGIGCVFKAPCLIQLSHQTTSPG